MNTIRIANDALPKLFGFFSIALGMLFPLQLSLAQNKVVVVPLFVDEPPVEIQPTAPVAISDPDEADYTLSAFVFLFFTIARDNITGLEWQRLESDTLRTWEQAMDECAGLELGGNTDWRLPDIVELHSIVDYGRASSPVADEAVFPLTAGTVYWTASNVAGDSASAWGIDFSTGNVVSNPRDFNFFTRCVR